MLKVEWNNFIRKRIHNIGVRGERGSLTYRTRPNSSEDKEEHRMSRTKRIALLALLTIILPVAACQSSTSNITPLTEEMLKNASYQGIYDEAVQLTDGTYEGEPFVEGGASRPTVTFIGSSAFGDLNGDGVDDAATVLAESSGGSGTFMYLAAVVNDKGTPDNVSTISLGDRAQIKSISIDSGKITLVALTHGPNDPMCCPTLETTTVYTLQQGNLVEVN